MQKQSLNKTKTSQKASSTSVYDAQKKLQQEATCQRATRATIIHSYPTATANSLSSASRSAYEHDSFVLHLLNHVFVVVAALILIVLRRPHWSVIAARFLLLLLLLRRFVVKRASCFARLAKCGFRHVTCAIFTSGTYGQVHRKCSPIH